MRRIAHISRREIYPHTNLSPLLHIQPRMCARLMLVCRVFWYDTEGDVPKRVRFTFQILSTRPATGHFYRYTKYTPVVPNGNEVSFYAGKPRTCRISHPYRVGTDDPDVTRRTVNERLPCKYPKLHTDACRVSDLHTH